MIFTGGGDLELFMRWVEEFHELIGIDHLMDLVGFFFLFFQWILFLKNIFQSLSVTLGLSNSGVYILLHIFFLFLLIYWSCQMGLKKTSKNCNTTCSSEMP
jgi:hypothetical protein